jgi:hypothetical protein
MNKEKKVATSNVATFRNDSVSCATLNMSPTYMMLTQAEPKYMTSSGYSKQQAKRQHESKTFLRRVHTTGRGRSVISKPGERRQQLSRRYALQRVMAKGEAPHFYQNMEDCEGQPME